MKTSFVGRFFLEARTAVARFPVCEREAMKKAVQLSRNSKNGMPPDCFQITAVDVVWLCQGNQPLLPQDLDSRQAQSFR